MLDRGVLIIPTLRPPALSLNCAVAPKLSSCLRHTLSLFGWQLPSHFPCVTIPSFWILCKPAQDGMLLYQLYHIKHMKHISCITLSIYEESPVLILPAVTPKIQ